MKASSRRPSSVVLAALILFGGGVALQAQVVIPATPKKFTKRTMPGGTGGFTITPGVAPSAPAPPPTVRTVTYVTLSGARQWTSTDGKPLLAKLIAFEQVVTESKAQDPAPAAPTLPAKPTVVRDGRVRLLAGTTPYELPLERLSPADREFIETVRRAVAATPVPAPAAAPAPAPGPAAAGGGAGPAPK